MGFEGDSFSSPAGSVVLASDSGARPVASPDMDEDMLLATSSDELEMESVEMDVSKKSVSCSTQQSPAYDKLLDLMDRASLTQFKLVLPEA